MIVGGKGGKMGGRPQGGFPPQNRGKGSIPAARGSIGVIAPKSEAAFIAFSTIARDETGIRTLVGQYMELDKPNHGRKTYRKMERISGHEDTDVHLYYWDERDGADFCGWWFGSQVGGAQVWSRNASKAMVPPTSGWTVPWDGAVKGDFHVMSASAKLAHDQRQAQTNKLGRMKEEEEKVTVDWEERVQKASERAAAVEIDVSGAMETAKIAMEGAEVDEDAVKVAADELAKVAKELAECQRFLAVESLASQKAPPELKAEVAFITKRVRELQNTVKNEQHRLKNHKLIKVQEMEDESRRIEKEAKMAETAEKQQRQLDEMLPSVIEKVDKAEDEAEKVAIAAAPLEVETSDELTPDMMESIKETEQRVRAAQVALSEAKRFLNGKLSQVQRFTADVKEIAVKEFDQLQEKLTVLQEKISPFKSIRQDHEQKVHSKKLLDDLNRKISGAEIEVEKAAMMTAPLGGDSMEGIKETESALSAAQSALAPCMRLVDNKLKTLEKKGEVYEEVKSLQTRAKSAQEKLDEIRKTVKETQVRVAADSLLKEAADKVSSAEDQLQKMSEAELPFLRGNPKGEEMESLISKAEELAVEVHGALSEAQTFVAKKLVEVARFSEGHAKAVREDLDALQKRLADGRSRLHKFKAGTADHKRTHMLEEVDVKITAAEAEMQAMQEASAALGNIGTAGDAVSESTKATLEKANEAERAAQASIIVARKCLLQKTLEVKTLAIGGSGAGSELGKFQTRVNNMQAEIAKLRNATKDAEERIRAKQTLAEVAMRLQAAEVEVDKVAAQAAPTDDDLPSTEAIDRLDKSSTSAATKLSATLKLVEIKLRNAEGFLKVELQGMKLRLSAADNKLVVVRLAFQEQKERAQAAEIVAEASSKVDSAQAALEKASQAELPFLKGIEVEAKQAAAAVGVCEAAGSVAQKCITDARSFVVERLAAAKKFTEKSASSCVKDLVALQKQLDTSAARLTELKRDTADRKRKTQMQASAEKITSVETSVQSLATTIAKFSDDRLAGLTSDEAGALLGEVATAEESAQKAVSAARKFLAERLQDIKSFSEAQRAPMTADLTKLQSRLTQCQVELAKLSRQCTEREQRYVAQKLIEDAKQSFEKLQVDIGTASELAASLQAADKSDLLKATYVQSVVGAVQAYMSKSETSVDAVFGMMTSSKEANQADFLTFLDKLQELTGKDDVVLTQDRAAAVFTDLSGNKDKLSATAFVTACKECCSCVVPVELMSDFKEGAKEVGVLEVGELVVVSEKQDDAGGRKHAHCILARDGTKGWARIQDDDGTSNFKPSQSGASRLDAVLAYVSSINSRCAETADALEEKAVEVSSVKQGPLVEVKTKLLELQMKIRQNQSKAEQLKKQVSVVRAEVTKTRKEEQQSVQETRCKEFATKTVKEATDAVGAAEAKASKVIECAKDGCAKLSISDLEAMNTTADEAMKGLEDAKAIAARIKTAYEGFKSTSRPLLLQASIEITKLAKRAETLHTKCKDATKSLRAARDELVKVATDKARSALRASARSAGKSFDDLFSEITAGKEEMTETQFAKFVAGLPNHGLSKDQVALIYRRFGAQGLKKVGFAAIVQEFCACTKAIALTDGFDIGSSKTVRMLETSETFEVLEGPNEDPETKVTRVRGRALRDAATGWVSVQGNKGTPFLKATEKPCLSAVSEAPLRESCDDSSAVVRPLVTGEVLELVEGPRENTPKPEIRLHCTACKDSAEGWVVLSSGAGVNASASSDFYICRSVIAMTDTFELKDCKVVKKVTIGDTLQVIGDHAGKQDERRDISRLRFRSVRDGKEGWVTLKGNQGTIYLELSKSHYVVDRAVALHVEAAPASQSVRQLEAGEAIEAMEPPKEEKTATMIGMRARALSDGKCGWIMISGRSPPVKAFKL